jgi:hypothetical protein
MSTFAPKPDCIGFSQDSNARTANAINAIFLPMIRLIFLRMKIYTIIGKIVLIFNILYYFSTIFSTFWGKNGGKKLLSKKAEIANERGSP